MGTDDVTEFSADAELLGRAAGKVREPDWTPGPDLGPLLAAWLDSAAGDAVEIGSDRRAVAVARVIAGTEPTQPELQPVAHWGHQVSMAETTCRTCAQAMLYNSMFGIRQHVVPTSDGHEAQPVTRAS